MDLSVQKPYGPNAGQKWDLLKDDDVKELEGMVQYEQPSLISGSPPCDPFSLLQNLSVKSCNAERRRRRLAEGTRHLRTAIGFYRMQHEGGRHIAHEHPLGCSSWHDEQTVELQRTPGVYTVSSPMCHWGMRVSNHGN